MLSPLGGGSDAKAENNHSLSFTRRKNGCGKQTRNDRVDEMCDDIWLKR